MPEYPDITVYIERLKALTTGKRLQRVRIRTPFLLRSFDPPIEAVEGKRVLGYRRLGKRIVFELEDELFMVIHLMIAGRLRWRKPGAGIPGKRGLAAFDFDDGTLLFTEAGTKKRASLFVVAGERGLVDHDRGGLELMSASWTDFHSALTARNHTLKRALTDPRILSGVGNAYSDEILHRARLSPFKQTGKLADEESQRLYEATLQTLETWTDRLRQEVGDGFPEKVTAFHSEMAVHGRYRKPCPDCGKPVQRIVYAQNEANYCAYCQTGGKLLADRALSRLLKKDWPKTLEQLESRKGFGGSSVQ